MKGKTTVSSTPFICFNIILSELGIFIMVSPITIEDMLAFSCELEILYEFLS